jgi:hypothetical protein
MKPNLKLNKRTIVRLDDAKLRQVKGGTGVVEVLAGAIGLGAAYITLAKEVNDLGYNLGKKIGEAIKN